MASIIKSYDKRSGNTYFYESESYWDKDKQQPRSRRKLIGKLDLETGEMIPTDGRGKNRSKQAEEKPAKPGPIPTAVATRRYYGATYLLDEVAYLLGVRANLKQCFPTQYKKILSVAYYLILEDSSMMRFGHWNDTHRHPYGEDISSQRSSELFSSISEEGKTRFLSLQAKLQEEDEYWGYDITSISSYSESLKQVAFGNNKEHDRLPQINLAMVFGEKSGLPFYYKKLPGNIPDVKTVKNLLSDFDTLGFTKVKMVMDRGFYSETNINALMKEHIKFLIGVKTSLSFVRKALDSVYEELDSFENYSPVYSLYSKTLRVEWQYTQARPYKGDTIEDTRRIYLHLFYNVDKAGEDKTRMDTKLKDHMKELQSGHRIPEHEAFYKKYFTVTQTPKRGIKVTVNDEAVRKAKRYYGYFALMSNEKMEAITALETYRNKDVIEKAFGNVKDRLNMRRLLVSSERCLSGKLFVAFVALILLSYIKKQMQDKKLFEDYTLQGLLDKLDVIECFEYPGEALQVGEILKKQEAIYEALGVRIPA